MKRPNRDECNEFADRIQQLAAVELFSRGYKVKQNDTNDGTNLFDLLATAPGGTALKIEVKGARLHKAQDKPDGKPRGLRWQARVHNHNSDVLLMYCEITPPETGRLEGSGIWFIIPVYEIAPRKQVTIWSGNPTQTAGIWARYLNAWDLLEIETW